MHPPIKKLPLLLSLALSLPLSLHGETLHIDGGAHAGRW